LAGGATTLADPPREPAKVIAPAPVLQSPRQTALAQLSRRIPVEFTDTRLEEVLNFLFTGIEVDILWLDADHAVGLDRETRITLKSQNASVLELIDRVLARVAPETAGVQTMAWQLSESGTLQVGPKERLNAFKRVVIYPVSDLLQLLPRFTAAPEIDLQAALQSRRDGGGLIFRDSRDSPPLSDTDAAAQRRDELITLIKTTIEPEQWTDNGGTGATMHIFQSSLIIHAPEYIHRQIATATRGAR
jgi:hypothetical protein